MITYSNDYCTRTITNKSAFAGSSLMMILAAAAAICLIAVVTSLAPVALALPQAQSAAAPVTTSEISNTHNNQNSLGYVYRRNATQRTVGSVIPWPKEIKFLNGTLNYLAFDVDNFQLDLSVEVKQCAIVKRAVDRYMTGLLVDDIKPSDRDDRDIRRRKQIGSLDKLIIASETSSSSASRDFICESMPHSEMCEAYSLEIALIDNKPVGRLTAETSWGLIRGLETFSQLIFNLGEPLSFGISPVLIRDGPRFKHRGYMLDTARHYISPLKIYKSLDAMSYNKLNVFHWHMVDDQSFPFASQTYPQLSRTTAFRPKQVYTRKQVRQIIDYAADRGIRVLTELDTPGHSYALRSVPNLLTKCYNTTTNQPNGDFGPIDPTKVSSYKSIAKIIEEFGSVFPEIYFHAGGDEVDYDCWKSNPEINKWLDSRNMTGKYPELSNYYIRRLYDLIRHYNKTMLVWEEAFDGGANLPKDAIVHVWKYINNRVAYMAELKEVVQSGYRAILSSCWYLNYIDYGQDWIKFYLCDPTSAPIESGREESLVLGGEICMWTEFVDNVNVISRTWPRASAAAERLWSPKSVNNIDEFLGRLEQHRCRLQYRGIHAEPVNGPGYC